MNIMSGVETYYFRLEAGGEDDVEVYGIDDFFFLGKSEAEKCLILNT